MHFVCKQCSCELMKVFPISLVKCSHTIESCSIPEGGHKWIWDGNHEIRAHDVNTLLINCKLIFKKKYLTIICHILWMNYDCCPFFVILWPKPGLIASTKKSISNHFWNLHKMTPNLSTSYLITGLSTREETTLNCVTNLKWKKN